MSQAFTAALLSASTNGRPIKVAATSSPGTTIHTDQTNATGSMDRVTLWATNTHTAAVTLTVQWGGTTSPDDHANVVELQPNRRALIADGEPIAGGLVIKAFAGTTNVVIVSGYVNRVDAFS